MSLDVKKAVITAVAKTIKGTSFVGIRNYETKRGEVANYTILVGMSYERLLANDMKALADKQEDIFNELPKQFVKEIEGYFSLEVLTQAYKNVADSLEKRLSSDAVKEVLRAENDPTIKASDAQLDAYELIAKGIKRHKETGEIYIFGVQMQKKVIVEAPEETKTKGSTPRAMTLAQNAIKKFCDFKQDKYRTFSFDGSEIAIQGVTIK